MTLQPDASVTEEDLRRGQRALVRDAAWASLAGSLYGGTIAVGFLLALGAGPFVLGLMAAIPFIAQAAQLPAIALIERVRQRRTIAVTAVTIARVLIVSLALLPFVASTTTALTAFVAAEVAITALGSIAGCAINSWLHQLLPRGGLGAFFARRLFWATTGAGVGALAAGFLVDHWPWGERVHAYAVTFAVAGLAGMVSSYFLAQVPEPRITVADAATSMWRKLAAPFRDREFRSVLIYIASWNAASNIAAPFLAVYLMQQLGFSLGVVTALAVASQGANAITLYVWGRVSDRLSNKAVLAVALPTYFACMLAVVFCAVPEPHVFTLPILALVHLVLGFASGGIGLATGNVSLKLAPHGRGTAYLAATSLVASITGGVAPLVGGALAHWFEAARLSVTVHWVWPGRSGEATVVQFANWEFLFALSFLLGMGVLHALSRVREGEEVSERVVVQHLALEALRTVNHVSSIGGVLGNLIAFGRIVERRLRRSRHRRRNRALPALTEPSRGAR